jgi:bis(5'-nucleosidyl)-tetraphosphatase
MERRERSAGILIFSERRAERTYLLLDYGKHWDYPKGHVHKNEDDLTAAMRELQEETGIEEIELVPGFAKEIIYFFRNPKRGLIRKEVIFFLASVKRQDVTLSHEHVGYAFLPFDEAQARLTYPTARQLLREADDYLKNLENPR